MYNLYIMRQTACLVLKPLCCTLQLHVDVSGLKVNSMQRSGTEAIRTQIKPSKPKREITNFTNSQNKKRTHSQSSEQLFPKMWFLSNRTELK